MRILLVHRYYWPDLPAYATMLHIMAQRFVEEGHQVTVFSTQPGYNNSSDQVLPRRSVVNGVEIIRTPLFKETKKNTLIRAVNVARFCFGLMCHRLWRFRRYDLMTVASFPPTVMGLMARCLCLVTGSKYLYHCQDLYPEVARASGLSGRKWLLDLAGRVDRRNCQKAGAVVVLSEDMKRTVQDRGVTSDNINIINNFVMDRFDDSVELPAEFVSEDRKFTVVFAGNMGRFQNLDLLIEAMAQLKTEPQIRLLMVGGGAMMKRLEQQVKDAGCESTVSFHEYQPLKSVMKLLNRSQLSIVSLAPRVIDCAYPSKTMTYVESGCRMLAIIEKGSELAKLIDTEDLGVVCDSPTAEEIAAAISNEYQRWKTNPTSPDHIRTIGDEHFGQSMILQKWVDLLKRLESN